MMAFLVPDLSRAVTAKGATPAASMAASERESSSRRSMESLRCVGRGRLLARVAREAGRGHEKEGDSRDRARVAGRGGSWRYDRVPARGTRHRADEGGKATAPPVRLRVHSPSLAVARRREQGDRGIAR